MKISTLVKLLLCIVAITSTGCSLFNKKNPPFFSNTLTSPEAKIRQAGFKNVSQLFHSMNVVTGNVPPPANLVTAYKVIAPWQSQQGDVNSVNASMLMSITEFAAQECNALNLKDRDDPARNASSGLRWATNGVVFANGPRGLANPGTGTPDIRTAVVGPNSIGASVIRQYTNAFWNRDPSAEEMEVLSNTLTEAIRHSGTNPGDYPFTNVQGQTINQPTDNDGTVNVLNVVCTLALASTEFLKN